MSDPAPLPDTLNSDGKSLYNPPADTRSSAYDHFPQPIDSSNNGFDFHIYYMQSVPSEMNFARRLHERIRREFPEAISPDLMRINPHRVSKLRIYKFWDKPVGPHPTAMFEILDNALGAVGHTPLIRLDKIARLNGLKCNLLGKVEYMSAGGSVKDRIAKAMVEAAEREGKLIPGKSVVIEPTSGNTAIVSTPSTPARPSSGKVDVVVAGAGTGGTVTGISRAIKKNHNKDCVVVGVDPHGSILALPDELNTREAGAPYIVEGIGYDFVPDVLARDEVDYWIKTSDEEAFAAVQTIMRQEALLVGGSSGSALGGALRWFSSDTGRKVADTEGLNVVVLLPDGIRNYMSKPWFLKIALESEPTALAGMISKVLNKDPPPVTIQASL
ncbi:hypothetical protein C0993_009109 [Termitomyces sp. T159_Od127]|nr:hypothetical protein C0993_009109 [Termitomyces sp. T159_Od127]